MRQDESVASEGSSFTRELGRLHRAMSMSTKRSLVVLDEVGRECRSDGEYSIIWPHAVRSNRADIRITCTMLADGAGLFIATIDEFLQRGQDCPVVLSATHHLRESPQLASLNYRSYAFTEPSVFAFRNEQERSKDISRNRSQSNERTCKLSSFRPLPTYTTLSPTSTGSNQALLAPPTHVTALDSAVCPNRLSNELIASAVQA